jgi:hypothetical protein
MEPHRGGTAKYTARPERSWLAGLLLAGNLVFPAVTVMLAWVTETPTGDAIDWNAESPKARLVDALLLAHACYSLTLVIVMRGWRPAAIVLGGLTLIVSAVVNFFAYFTVTGVYW